MSAQVRPTCPDCGRCCAVPGCHGSLMAYGYCNPHYLRFKRHGDPLAGRPNTNGQALVWLRAVVAEPDRTGCRDWPWARSTKGYGRVLFNGVYGSAAHAAIELDGRPRPEAPNNHALHSCDRPMCVAPWHLRWGSNDENKADERERDRNARGQRNGHARLTESDVREIRARRANGERLKALGVEFGVSDTSICGIVKRRTWAHVD